MNHRCRARYAIVSINETAVVIRDVGHDHGCPSITNDVEAVVQHVIEHVPVFMHPPNRRRLFYIDSDGNEDEIVVRYRRFHAFRWGPRPIHPPDAQLPATGP